MSERERSAALAALHGDLTRVHLESMQRQTAAFRDFLEATRSVVGQALGASVPGPVSGPEASWPEAIQEWERSPDTDPWVVDHTPLWTVPVLPLTTLVDLACSAASEVLPGAGIPVVERLEARAWCDLPAGGRRGRTVRKAGSGGRVEVEVQVADATARDGFRTCVVAHLTAAPLASPPWPGPLLDPAPVACPYEAQKLFHGPSLQLMSDLAEGEGGSQARVDAASRGVPYGLVHPGLLDASLHAVPFMEIHRWYPELGAGKVAFPYRLRDFVMHRPPPREGLVEVQVRRLRCEHGVLPVVGFWLADDEGPLASYELTLALVPLGPLADQPMPSWKRFLAREGCVAGLAFTAGDGATRTLDQEAFASLGWLPGGAARVLGLDPAAPDLLDQAARRDHAGQLLSLHPSRVVLDEAGRCANARFNPLVVTSTGGAGHETAARGPGELDLTEIYRWWGPLGIEPSLVRDVGTVLVRRLVRRIVLEDPAGWERRRGQPVLYLANHQIAMESFLFCLLGVAFGGTGCYGITRTENITGILGAILGMQELVLGDAAPLRALAFDSRDPAELHALLDEYRRAVKTHGASLYVAVEGQRALRTGIPVARVSSVFCDLAIEQDIPIVPVRMAGGLPREPLPAFRDLPHRMAGQDYFLGAAIEPALLAELPLGERRRLLLTRLNALGPEHATEEPNPPDPDFEARVGARVAAGVDEVGAVILEGLADLEEVSDQTAAFLRLVAGEGTDEDASDPVAQSLLAFLGP